MEPLLTLQEVADLLKISVKTVYKPEHLQRLGGFPPARHRGLALFSGGDPWGVGKSKAGGGAKPKGAARTAREDHHNRLNTPPITYSEPASWVLSSLIIDYLEEV